MKKISNNKIIKSIIRFFDKYLITPITKIILFIGDCLKSNDKGIERVLNNRQALVIISLIFAIFTFYAIDHEKVSLVDDNAEILHGIRVDTVYNKESYVIEGLPDSVDVLLVGKKQNVYLAKQYPAEAITVDLSDLTPGSHKVKLNYKKDVTSVEYQVNPSEVTVVVYKKMSETREVSADIIHKDSLDTKLNIESISLNKDKVTVKGPEYKLEQVASVKALIDVNNLTSQKVGKQKLTDIQLIAYDSNGQIVDVEIVPDTLEAEVVIASPSKTVPIRIETEGELDGKAIKSLTPSKDQVTLYGPQEVLDKIEYLPVSIDVTNINSDKNYTINLTNPTGIREISVKSINVKLVVDEIVSTEISGVTVNKANLDDSYDVQAFDADSREITVIVKGSQTVINALKKEDIYVEVDLSGLGVGDHEVPVKVTGSDTRLTYTPRVKTVRVRIVEK